MSKRHHITFTKPEEPSFLKKLKEQVGYKEGPTVDTKFEDLGPVEDLEDEEQPTVVVLNRGDLTAEEAQREQEKLDREAEETPADLNSRIVFKPPCKKNPENQQTTKEKNPKKRNIISEITSKVKKAKNILSFDEEENDDQ